jgi:acyl-CoA hydrolase
MDEVLNERLRLRSWHLSTEGRELAELGAVEYIPARAHDIVRHMQDQVDVALVRVTPPDASGNCSLGPSASYSRALLDAAKVRIAEVDPAMPRTLGPDVTVAYSEFDHVVETESPTPTYPSTPQSHVTEAIARHVASLISDGSTVQLGIGAVPEGIARQLADSDVRNLRLLGLVSDPMLDLIESPAMSTAPEAVSAVELLGSHRLFEYASNNPRIKMMSSLSIHNPLWLAQQSRLVSVCSALEVDLTGQVASEQAGGRAIAGVGGSADFFEGAHLSPGGVRIVALPSLTTRGESRISTVLAPGTPVTLARHSVDYVVTEHGIAYLAGGSLQERTEALVAVAHPTHRERLTAETELALPLPTTEGR